MRIILSPKRLKIDFLEIKRYRFHLQSLCLSQRIMSQTDFAHKQFILSSANNILSNQDALRKHIWKSQPCRYGHNCKSLSDCGQAHFLEEYRIPVCLYLEFCQSKDCKMYHPHLGAPHEYITFIGINKILPTRQDWDLKRHTFQSAREFIADKERLRQHLYRTSPCVNGPECKTKDICQSAHYADEYRIPICVFLDFCEEKGCKYFHPSRQTKENFMESVPKFKYISEAEKVEKDKNMEKIEKEKVMSLLRPLEHPNPLAVPSSPPVFSNRYTKLCDFVKKGMCRKNGCPFAHSLDDLILKGITSSQEKRLFLEKTGNKVDEIYMRPSYKNCIDRKIEYDQFKFVIQMRAEENGEKYEESDSDSSENYESSEDEDCDLSPKSDILVSLSELEIERHKEDFLLEIEDMEMEEFDDGVVVETFYFNKDLKKDQGIFTKFGQIGKFSWADDESDKYYEGL